MRFRPSSECESPSKWPSWLAFLLFAVLLHLGLLLPKFPWNPTHSAHRVEINPVSLTQVEKIRKQWQDAQQKEKHRSLLIDKNPQAPRDHSAPTNARYFSDRNIRVEREQIARSTSILPRTPRHAPTQARPKPPRSIGRLENLGIPLRLTARSDPPPPPEESTKGDQGGDQWVRDPHLPEGSENLLNAQESVFYSFYSRLYESIGPVWQSLIRQTQPHTRLQAGDYSTVADVIFDEEGNLIGVRLIQSSGVIAFDQAVERAWTKVARFPNPPRGLLDANHQVHTGWTFNVQVGANSGFNYLPPERNY